MMLYPHSSVTSVAHVLTATPLSCLPIILQSLSRLSKARDNAAREKRYKSGDERGRNARGDARGSSGSLFNGTCVRMDEWSVLRELESDSPTSTL